jgi:hypothetical protein
LGPFFVATKKWAMKKRGELITAGEKRILEMAEKILS